MFSIKDTVVSGSGAEKINIDLENYMTKNEGVLKEDFQNLTSVVNTKASNNHRHGIGEIQNLQETLINKSDTGHKHSIGDVSNLNERLTVLEETLKNHAEVIKILADKVGIEVEKS